ncbi:MAG: acetylxylan esterase [Candidatus Coatesbacteria bacterium]
MRAFTMVIAVGLIVSARAADSAELVKGWKFALGDGPERAATGFDDSGWKPIEAGKPWEQAGYPDYDGYAWYRIRVRVPAAWRNSEAYRVKRALLLSLGPIDDCDQTFFNGELVGGTGRMPPEYASAYNVPRRYEIAESQVNWDGDNVIAVRVYDGGGAGGLVGGPLALRAPAASDYIELAFGLGSGDGSFPAGKPMEISVELRNSYVKAVGGRLAVRVTTDDGKPVRDFAGELKVLRGGKGKKAFSFDPPAPGIYRVSASLALGGGLEPVEKSMNLGYAITAIDDPLTRQPDFLDFWERTLKELAAVPPQYKVTKSGKDSTAEVDVFLVEMRSLGNARVRGWLSVPRKGGPFPAVLMVPGHSANQTPFVWFTDMIVFSFNIRGHGNSQDDVNPGFPGYLTYGLESPDTFIYRGAYADCVRAVDYLASRPDVDPRRIGVEGGSQGGALTFATAALDRRVALAAPDVPFLSDFEKYVDLSEWLGNEWRGFARDKRMTFPDVLRVLSYFDIKNFAPLITCPLFMGAGLQDPTCPPRINFAAYNQVTSKKDYRLYPFGDHGGGGDVHWKLKHEWMRRQFGLAQ